MADKMPMPKQNSPDEYILSLSTHQIANTGDRWVHVSKTSFF